MTHTKGPWKVAYEPGKHIVVGCPERGICIVPNDDLEFEPIRLANAHLIAASPEMLEALEGAKWLIESYVDFYGAELEHSEEYQDVENAIKKARG